MNNKNIEESKVYKEGIKSDIEDIMADYSVYEWEMVEELSNLIQAEKEQYLDEFVEYALKTGYIVDDIKMYEKRIDIPIDFTALVEQFKKESV